MDGVKTFMEERGVQIRNNGRKKEKHGAEADYTYEYNKSEGPLPLEKDKHQKLVKECRTQFRGGRGVPYTRGTTKVWLR